MTSAQSVRLSEFIGKVIEPRISEIDVLSATVLGDKQLKKLSNAIAEKIIFDK